MHPLPLCFLLRTGSCTVLTLIGRLLSRFRGAFKWLAGEGYIYETIDDHHFKWTG